MCMQLDQCPEHIVEWLVVRKWQCKEFTSQTEHIRAGILPVMREEYCLCALHLGLNF